MAAVSGVFWAVRHLYRQKVQLPLRSRRWSRKNHPFEHRTMRGLVFRLYPGEFVDRFVFRDGIYERSFLDFVRAYYVRNPGAIAMDIGSNIGNHAIYLSDCFREVHCFDPNPVAMDRLRENVRLSKVENMVLHQVGLSNTAGELPFLINDDGNLGVSHFLDSDRPGSVLLPIVVGDEYVDLPSISFVKIDVENHEPEVFEGLRRTIAKHRPVIAFEYHGHLVPPGTFDRIGNVLKDYIFAEAQQAPADLPAGKRFAWHVKHQGRPTLAAFKQPEQRTYENILAFPDAETFSGFKTFAAP